VIAVAVSTVNPSPSVSTAVTVAVSRSAPAVSVWPPSVSSRSRALTPAGNPGKFSRCAFRRRTDSPESRTSVSSPARAVNVLAESPATPPPTTTTI